MSVPQQYIGNYGHIGFTKEPAFGTGVAATNYVAFDSEGFETDPGVQPVPTIRGTRAENNEFFLGEIKAVGNLAMPFRAVGGMQLMGGALGSDYVTGATPSNATTLSAGAAVGATSVSVTSATGYIVGGFIQLVNTAGQSEVHKILTVVSTTLTFAAGEALVYAYASGDATHTVVAPFTHTMTPNEAGIPSFTVEKALSTLKSQQYVGCIVNKAGLTLATNAVAKVQYDFLGKIDTLIDPTVPSYTTDTGFAVGNISATIFDIGSPFVTAAKLDIDNGGKSVYTFGDRSSTLNYSGSRKITGSLSTILQSTTPYTDAMAGTHGALSVALSKSGSESATFNCSQILYGKPSQPLKLGELIMQELPFTAYFLPGSTYDIQAVVVNSVWLTY